MPGLRNLLRRPGVTEVRPAGNDALRGRLLVRVEGLACRSLCVRRTEAALRALPGVTIVRFAPDPDRFELEIDGPPPDASAVARAVDSVIVAPWARRLIAAVAERVQRAVTRSPS